MAAVGRPRGTNQMAFNWIITKDHLASELTKPRVGCGCYDRAILTAALMEQLPFHFRLYDDDDQLYYEGRSNDCTSQAAFRPLDWAVADSGCTRIDYSSDGGMAWETL